jgi:hypothetical protein
MTDRYPEIIPNPDVVMLDPAIGIGRRSRTRRAW